MMVRMQRVNLCLFYDFNHTTLARFRPFLVLISIELLGLATQHSSSVLSLGPLVPHPPQYIIVPNTLLLRSSYMSVYAFVCQY